MELRRFPSSRITGMPVISHNYGGVDPGARGPFFVNKTVAHKFRVPRRELGTDGPRVLLDLYDSYAR